MDAVLEVLARSGVSILNGFLLVVYTAWENLLTLLQVPVALLLVRLVELPQAQIEGYAIGAGRQRRVLLGRGGRLLLALGASAGTSLFFPATVDAILLFLWILGGLVAALLRIERANLIARTQVAVLTEVGVLWGLKLFQAILDMATVAEWAVATGLTQEGAASVLARNVGYVNLVALLAALFVVPGGFLSYLWQRLTVLRNSPTFRLATLEEILYDVVGRRERGVF